MISSLDVGYCFKNEKIKTLAFTHKSYSNENKLTEDNEKLEFLGDAILDFILSEYLMESYPADKEGALSKKRASLVNETTLSHLAIKRKLGNYLLLGKGEKNLLGQNNPRLLASVYEALIGAIYLDSNFISVRNWVRSEFKSLVEELTMEDHYEKDYKTKLQEWVQKHFKTSPTYVVVEESGPPHNKEFKVDLKIKENIFASAIGKTKKSAEQLAAKEVLEKINEPDFLNQLGLDVKNGS